MTCSACGYPRVIGQLPRGGVVREDDSRPFIKLGLVSGVDPSMAPDTGAYSLGNITRTNELFACPVCGTIKINLEVE